MPGRPPKPTAVLRVQGTARKDCHGKRTDLELGGDLPQPPSFLSKVALEESHRVCTIGKYAKALSPADRGPLTLYCVLWAELVSCQNFGAEMQTSRMASLGNLTAKFGMPPGDRARFNCLKRRNPRTNSPHWMRLPTAAV